MSAEFPGDYKTLDTLGRVIYFYNDGTTSYQCIVGKNDSLGISTSEELAEAYKKALKGMMNKLPEAKINLNKTVWIQGLSAMRTSAEFKLNGRLYQFESLVVVINRSLMFFQIISLDKNSKRFEDFMARVKFDASLISQTQDEFDAEKLGESIGALIFLITIAIVVVVIIKANNKKT